MDWITAIGFSGAAMGAAATGAMFPPGRWYDALSKPNWTPPNWLFPLAWTLLYIAMVYAAWRVARTPNAGPALALWSWQIVFNALWTPVFFGLRRIDSALLVIAPLWIAVAGTCVLFWQADPLAGALLLPLIVWQTYAFALNVSIWQRNRGAATN